METDRAAAVDIYCSGCGLRATEPTPPYGLPAPCPRCQSPRRLAPHDPKEPDLPELDDSPFDAFIDRSAFGIRRVGDSELSFGFELPWLQYENERVRAASLSFTKTCNPDFCTVANSSNPSLVPNGSTLTYGGPRFDPHLSSGFLLATSDGTATGHCSLSWATGLGRCVVDGGTGSLTGLHAVLSEWVDFGTGDFATFVFHLDGTYHIEGAGS